MPVSRRLEIFIKKVRPAPLQAAILTLMKLNQRREIPFEKYRFYSDPTSNFGSALLAGGYEPDMASVLKAYLVLGGTFIDFGANEGFFSVLASDLVGPTGHVVAVEPQTRLLATIQRNFAINRCDNCRVVRCVLSDSNGRARIHLAPSTNTGSSTLFRHTRYPLPTEIVPSWMLKRFIAYCSFNRVDLAKFDIEGAEYNALIPSSDVLRSDTIRNIDIEYHPASLKQQGHSPDDLHMHLLACGYRVNRSFGPAVYEFAREE